MADQSKLAKVADELRMYVEAFVFAWPGYLGNRMREAYLRRRLASSRGRLHIETGVRVMGAEGMHLNETFRCGRMAFLAAHGGGTIRAGRGVALNERVHLNASGGGTIVLGDYVIIGPGTVFRTSDHRFDRLDMPIQTQGHVAKSIEIGDDVWIGANVVVLGGVRIGRGAVIGAGAVVTRDIPEFAIAVGVPARPVGSRLSASDPAPPSPSLTARAEHA